MKSLPALPLGLLAATILPCSAQLVINEVDADTPGTDAAEFVELYDGGAGATSLDGYVLVFFNGSSDSSYAAYDLDGFSTDANGFFLVGNSAVSGTSITFANNFLQNGADAVALYLGNGTDFPNGTLATGTNLVDAIVYDTDDVDDTGLLTTFGQSTQYNENENSAKDTQSISRLPDGGATIGTVDASPGAPNPSLGGALTISLDVNSISEDGLTVIEGTVSAPGPVTGNVTVTVTVDDEGEAETFDTVITDGESDGFFVITAVDDFWPDGDQTVTVTVSAPTFTDDSETFTVTDDDTNFTIIVNEVYNDIPGAPFDANNDGVFDSDDEFVEVLNVSASPVDLSGATLSDSSFVRHIFPLGTVLQPGCAVLVFAGGGVEQGSVQFEFGDTPVQIADPQNGFTGLSLTDTGDTVTLRDALGTISGSAGAELHVVTLPDQSGATSASSITTSTDGDASTGYILHTATIEGTEASPGTTPAGGSYCSLSDTLSVSFNVPDISEGAGTVAAGGTVTLPAPAPTDLFVYVSTSDDTELASPTTAAPLFIGQGDSSVDFDLSAVDDLDTDGTISVTLTARVIGYLNGSAAIDVTDDDTVPYTPPNLIITEIMSNPATSEPPGEWIEIYNADSVSVDLSGFVIDDEDSDNWDPISGGILEPGKYAVIYDVTAGLEADVRADWGIPADALVIGVAWGSLANSPSATSEVLELLDPFMNVLDVVNFDDSSPWPGDPNGISFALISTAYDDVSNDSGANWVLSSDASQANAVSPGGAIYSTSDLGSPGFDGTTTGPVDFASWAAANGIPGEGFDDDSDQDGIPTGVEYAIDGLDPNAVDSLASAFDGSTLSFTKRAEAVANGDVSYAIQESTDLGVGDPWEEASVGYTNDATTISFVLPTGQTRVFARLVVEPVLAIE